MSTHAGNVADGKNTLKARPLRKKNPQSQTYLRDKKIEAKIVQLLALESQQVLEVCAIVDTKDLNYVPSECLLYLVRNNKGTASIEHREKLHAMLMERVLRNLPANENYGGEGVFLTDEQIRDSVFGRFAELVAKDESEYDEKLDFFEIKFNMALRRLRLTASEKAWKEENQSVPLENEGGNGEISAEVEEACGSVDPFDPAKIDNEYYRSQLPGAINTLPDNQKKIIEMWLNGIPIDSQDPNAVTIAKALGKSEKTIRSHRDQAFQALKEKLTGNKPL